VLGTVKVALKAPLVVVIAVGAVTSAAPLSASVTCSWRPKPLPVTVTVAPGAAAAGLTEMLGVSAAMVMPAVAARLLTAPVARSVCGPAGML